MTTPIILTGWEHGVATPVVSGGGLGENVTGAVSVQGDIKNTGNYAVRFYAASASIVHLGYSLATPNLIVGRLYFRFAAWPNIDNEIVYIGITAGAQIGLKLRVSDKKVFVRFFSAADGNACATVIELDKWYRLDFKFDVSANPSKADFQIDGVAAAQSTYAQAATTFTLVYLGPSNSGTYDLYEDDFVLSLTAEDYPIGPGGTQGLSPSSDGTHNNSGGVINDSGDNTIDGSTYFAYSELNEVPLTGILGYVYQAANGTANYVAVNFANISATHAGIIGAEALLAYTSATTTGNNGGCIITKDDFSTSTTLWGAPGALADYSDGSTAAPWYKRVIVAGATDDTTVNALAARLGYSGDANPDPYWINLMVEVAYTTSAGTVNTETGTTEAALSAAGGDATTFSDAGAPQIAAVARGGDATTFTDKGTPLAALTSRGTDATTFTEAGRATGAATIGGTRVKVFERMGRALSALLARALDAVIFSEAGRVSGAAAVTGSDVTTFNEAGRASSAASASGTDVATLAEAGAGIAGATVGGVSEFIAQGATTYTETGSVVSAALARGADVQVYGEAGFALSATTATGADGATFVESGRATAGAAIGGTVVKTSPGISAQSGTGLVGLTASGTDVAIFVETGRASASVTIDGAAVQTGPAVSTETGRGLAGLTATGADAVTMVEAGHGTAAASVAGSVQWLIHGATIYSASGTALGSLTASGTRVVVFGEAGLGLLVGVPLGADTATFTDAGLGLVGVTAHGVGQAVNTAFALHIGTGRVRLLNELYEIDVTHTYDVSLSNPDREIEKAGKYAA